MHMNLVARYLNSFILVGGFMHRSSTKGTTFNAIINTTKLYNNFNIVKKVVNKIERVKYKIYTKDLVK